MTNNTTFTALTTGTRDSTADKGAFYFLDGNVTDGRLNIANGATWKVGDNTTIAYLGNPGHSFNLGVIEADSLKLIGHPTGGGRLDFGFSSCGWKTTDLTFVFLGDGNIYNHLEDTADLSNMQGYTKFHIDMNSGEAYLQFNVKEYPNVVLDVKPTNSGVVKVYPARSTAGYTSLTGFTTKGLTSILLLAGLTATSHGRIYDPVYEGVANNLITLQTDSVQVGNQVKEYFSIDVTSLANADVKAYVTNNDNTVLFNDALDSASLIPKANDGVTPLSFYENRKVILCEVRSVNHIANATRKTIKYRLRRIGFNDLEVVNFISLNSPIELKTMVADEHYSSSVLGVEIDNSIELYDGIQQALQDDVTISKMLSVNGSTITIANGWSLHRDQTLTSPIVIDKVNSQIKVKTGANGLQQTEKFNSIIGTVDASFDNHTSMLYLNASGDTTVRFVNLNPENFTLDASYPASVLVRKVGDTTWTRYSTHTSQSIVFNPPPNEDWEYSVRVPGYDWVDATTFNTGAYGAEISANLNTIKDLDGNVIYSKTIDEAIVGTFSYNATTQKVEETNTTGALLEIPFTEAFVGIQRVQHDPNLVAVLDDRMTINAERNGFSINATNPTRFKLTDTSDGNVRLLFSIESIVNGEKVLQIDRFEANTSGYYILMSSQVINLSTTIPTASENAQQVRTELATELARIDENISAEKIANVKKVNDTAVASIDEFKQGANVVVDALLDVPFGFKSDGVTQLTPNTLGEHWFVYYPQENVRQLLEIPLDGTTPPTRFQPIPGVYGEGTFGDALRKVLDVKAKTDNLPDNTETEINTIKADSESAKTWAIKAVKNTQKV